MSERLKECHTDLEVTFGTKWGKIGKSFFWGNGRAQPVSPCFANDFTKIVESAFLSVTDPQTFRTLQSVAKTLNNLFRPKPPYNLGPPPPSPSFSLSCDPLLHPHCDLLALPRRPLA